MHYGEICSQRYRVFTYQCKESSISTLQYVSSDLCNNVLCQSCQKDT